MRREKNFTFWNCNCLIYLSHSIQICLKQLKISIRQLILLSARKQYWYLLSADTLSAFQPLHGEVVLVVLPDPLPLLLPGGRGGVDHWLQAPRYTETRPNRYRYRDTGCCKLRRNVRAQTSLRECSRLFDPTPFLLGPEVIKAVKSTKKCRKKQQKGSHCRV